MDNPTWPPVLPKVLTARHCTSDNLYLQYLSPTRPLIDGCWHAAAAAAGGGGLK